MSNPTRRAMILTAITDYRCKHGHPPSQQEIADMLYITRPGLHYHLVKMRQDGIVAWEDGRPNTLRVVKEDKR